MTGLDALDLFCGAGGSSTGLVGAGVNVLLAANHWDLAVKVHQLNHPGTDHDCADISAVDPRRYPATRILWASPECTNHSVAKGVRRATGQGELFGDGPDPSAERSRATMWDVPRFAEAMRDRGQPYEAIIVENVVDARWWVGWRGWVTVMEDLGYAHHVVYLNSAFAHGRDYAGAPQYRDRIYVVFWLAGARKPDLDIRPPAWCPKCAAVVNGVQVWKKPQERWGRYRAQYVYLCPDTACRTQLEPFALPAAAAINWDDLGGVIGSRVRPLAAATRERIRAGLARYGRPMLAPAGGTWNESALPTDVPFRARTTRETEGIACPPFIAVLRGQSVTSQVNSPLGTVTAGGGHHGFVNPPMVVPTESRDDLRCRPVTEPKRTQTGRQLDALVTPAGFVMRNNNNSSGTDGGEMCSPFGEPIRTLTAKGHQSVVVVPDALLMPYYGTGVARPVGVPAGTVTTRDRHALVTRSTGEVLDDEIDACTFRMLEPGEIGRAMAFPVDYLMDGTKRDRVRMYGNAVTPPAARLVAERVVAALLGAS